MIRQDLEHWLDQYIESSGYQEVQAVYAIKDNTPIVERYYNNSNALTRYPIQELGYMILALLTGVAIDKRVLRSIEVPIGTHIKEFMLQYYTLYHRMKVKHLLTMSSGIEYEEEVERFSNIPIFKKIDTETVSRLVKLPLTQVPGLRYQYKKVDVLILSALLQQVVGYSLCDFCYDTLFSPMHIWEGFTYNQQSISLSAMDLAKIGQLILHSGYYDNRKLISAGFIKDMITPCIANKSFGYQLRLYPNGYGAVERNGSQLMVLPNENLVCVVLARNSQFPRYYGGIVSGILDYSRGK